MGRSRQYRNNRNLLRDRTKQIGDNCRACNGAFRWDVPWYHPLAFTANHITEVVNGGTDEIDNLEPMHHACNTSAGGRLGAARSTASVPGRPSNVALVLDQHTHDPKSQEWP